MATPVVSYPGAKWRFYPHMVDYFPIDMKVFIELLSSRLGYFQACIPQK